MPFAFTVKSDATNKTPNVASVRHMSVELSTTPQIARIEDWSHFPLNAFRC